MKNIVTKHVLFGDKINLLEASIKLFSKVKKKYQRSIFSNGIHNVYPEFTLKIKEKFNMSKFYSFLDILHSIEIAMFWPVTLANICSICSRLNTENVISCDRCCRLVFNPLVPRHNEFCILLLHNE